MGQTCGCGGKDKQSVQDTDENEFFNENWNKAVLNDSTVGCKTIFNNDTEVIDQLVDRVTGERAVHFAVKNRNTDLLEFLLENECDTDVQRLEDGRTPLHIAAEYNHVPMIRLLLMYGCDSQIKDKNNKIARDLCSKNLKREFNNAKITALRRQKAVADEKEGARSGTKDGADILIHGKPIDQANLSTIRKLNTHTDTQTEASKRHKAKLEEIQNREDAITDFGRIIGCEVDELGAFFEKLDEEGREDLWKKIMHGHKTLEKPTDVKKLLLALCATVVRAKLLKAGKSVKHLKIEDNPVEYLVGVLRRKFPRDKRNKKVLTKSVFVKKLHQWFYEIHDSIDWQETTMESTST